jgi:two-component system, OmpR family, phosphate regulon sensor histidine kinase PhoR
LAIRRAADQEDDAMEDPPRRDRALPLWARIAGTVLVAFLAATAVAGVYLGTRLHGLADRMVEERVLSDLALLSSSTSAALEAGDTVTLTRLAKSGRASGVRITVILPSGEVVAESDHPLPLENHGDRPEFRAAMTSGSGESVRHSATLDDDLLYVARRLESPSGAPLGVLRLARPRTAVAAIDADVLHVMLLAGLLGLPVAALVGWLAARRIAQPLEDMTAAAARMAGGDFSRLPIAERGDEAGRLAEALREMGQDLEALLRTSEEGRAELSAILESMTEGVVALDRREHVLHANLSAAECLGLPSTPAGGTPFVEIVRLPEISAVARAALSGKGATESTVTLPGTAGRVLAVSAAPIRSATGVLRGAVVVLRDVTVVTRLERTRLDFVANVSHELRTPLAAMSSAMETVQSLGDEDPSARAQMVDLALRHAKRLGAIVDDLLTLSKIESEGDRLERMPVPLLRAVRQSITSVAPAAAAAGVRVELAPDPADLHVMGHEGRLEQVWVNLLTNAIKYNRRGGDVKIRVEMDPTSREACVAVRDTGQGIPAEAIPRIFERFYRVDKGRSREQGGTGLGLAIVKHIVRAHRGRIEVESAPGEGSTFRVWLPAASASAP